MTVAKLTEELNHIVAGMTVLENVNSDQQRVAMTRKSLENSFFCYKELPRVGKEKEKFVCSNVIARFFSHAQRLEQDS